MKIMLNDGKQFSLNDTIYAIVPMMKKNIRGKTYTTKNDREVVIVKMKVLRMEARILYSEGIGWECNGLAEPVHEASDDKYTYNDCKAYEFNSYSTSEAADAALDAFCERGFNQIHKASRGGWYW